MSEAKAGTEASEGKQGKAGHAKAKSSSEGGVCEAEGSPIVATREDTLSEAALGPALELTPQAKGRPIEELSAQEANDMTCAICLDQIPVPELCAIKGCDHVYCGTRLPSCCCTQRINLWEVAGRSGSQGRLVSVAKCDH